ncbi:MAG: three-Cys-motif partner protein TcmP [Candidatus Hatepunaea meridiana]|nr:three-Cys-motif partner protein TcmP [Candidatus Hatepunaea meridiana]
MSYDELNLDKIGYWSEIKLDIVKKYAKAYSEILTKQPLSHVYIDGFAGYGVHKAKSTGEYISGSPLNALLVEPMFDDYYLVDLDGNKADNLRKLVGDRSNVYIFQGDCNKILLNEILPRVRFKDYRRGLCLLDPYGLNLNWEVIETAGKLKTIDLFLNFPIMGINRNVLWKKHEKANTNRRNRMNAFWGDASWFNAAYAYSEQLTFYRPKLKKSGSKNVVDTFRDRLKAIAEFSFVPEPIPMRNSNGAIIYYLFFASQKPVASKIVEYIFSKYENMGMKEWQDRQ